MVRGSDWRRRMLKRLQNRLQIVLIIIFMAIVSLILCFSFWNTWQSRHLADVTYIQRMASLVIYQLESDPENPEELLSNYEKEMHVYSILKDAAGHILFQNDSDTLTDLNTLVRIADENCAIESPDGSAEFPPASEQGGYTEIAGNHHDRYYFIPSSIRTKSGQQYSLFLFYQQPAIGALALHLAPSYCVIWFLAFVSVLFVSRFLLRRAFLPTEQMLQSQKDFIASASHELKSPLAVIMANADTIQDSVKNAEPQIRNSLNIIDAECVRMSRLVRDLLFLASSDADKWTLQPQEVNIDTLLITLYEAYQPVCQKKRIHLELNLEDSSFPLLYTDKERLFQLLSIFLDNALSYSPEESGIEIRTSQTAKTITFSVIDHGPGIAEKDKPFIFDRFYCADKSRTDKSHFGLGLSIAKELARMLSGKVGLEDTPGGGATFLFTLPVK